MKFKKGDNVTILKGKDKGKSGKIVKVLPKLNKVIVDGINMVKRAYKPSVKKPKGGIKEELRPIHVSNVAMLVAGEKNKFSRVGYKVKSDGQKVRVYRQADNKEIK